MVSSVRFVFIKPTISTLFIVFIGYFLNAQVSYIPMNTDASMDQMEVLTYSLSGSTTAQSSVTNGSAGYNIPISMPAGTSGIVPEIAINYTSNARSSTVGYGWGLSGISVISRTGQSNYYDGNVTGISFNTNDRFALDGNRLLLESGNYGLSGSTYNFESENFSRITAFGGTSGNPDHFVMETKDGIKYEYGNGFGSKDIHSGLLVKDWYLSKMIYPDGNYITYKYKKQHSISGFSISQQVIDEIYFTANDAASIENFASVKFVYGVRTDRNAAYLYGVQYDQMLLINDIQVLVGSLEFRNYKFRYSYRNGNSYLSVVEERSGVCNLTETKFKYGDEPAYNKIHHNVQPINANDNFFPSNLNGDGTTDLLLARQNSAAPMFHTYFHGVSDQSFTTTLTANSTVVGVSDCNGDQIDDVAVLQAITREVLVGEDPLGNPQYQYYDIHKFKLYHNGDLSNTLNYNQVFELPEIPDSLLRLNEYLSSTFGGDFNGDGLGDYFFINNSTLYVSYGQRSLTQPLTPWAGVSVISPNFTPSYDWGSDVEKLIPIEFDGDGKTDLLLINGAWSAIFSFTSQTSLTEVFFDNNGLFDQNHLLYQGDFNGDGKTDFLRRAGAYNSTNWLILFNIGVGFISGGFEFPRTPSITQQDFGVYFGDIVSTSDFNGDGKSDVLLLGNLGGHSFYTDLFLSKGLLMSDPYYEEHYNIPFMNSHTGNDYAGIDGKARSVYNYGTGLADPLEISMSPKYKDNLLVSVKNGELNTTIFDYKLMSEKIDIDDDFYVRGPISNAVNLISNIQMPVWLVKDFKMQNGLGDHNNYTDAAMKVQTMKYANAKVQRSGKGIIGFGKTCMEDKWSYLRTQSYNSVNTQFAIMLPDSVVTEFVTGADFTKSHSEHQVSNLGGGRYLMTADKMTMFNYHENRTTIQDFQQYDAYANPTLVSSSTYTGTPSILINNTTTATSFGAYGSIIPNKPTNITNTVFRIGTPSYSSTALMDYNSLGQVTMKKEFAGQPKETITSYLYWPHGGIQQTTINSSGLAPQIIYTDYDPKGRYIIQKRNTNNDIIYNAVYGNTIIGRPTQETNEAGVTASMTYDCFGRVSTMTSPTGVSTVKIYSWEGSHGEKKEISLTSNRPTVTTYFDRLGRKKKTETQGFNGEIITQTSNYDHIGNPSQITSPYKAGEPILTTTSTYGAAYTAQRIAGTTTNIAAFGSTQYAYTYDQGYETITTTAPDGKISSAKIDASGKTVQTTDTKGTVLDFAYYSHGGLREVKQGSTVLVSMEYDEYNRKKKQTDISAGITQYDYDAYGRMKSETNAKGQITSMDYDVLGRLYTVTRSEGVTTYEYWPAGVVGKAFKIKKVIGHAGDIHEMDYDAVGRVVSDKVTIDGQSYETTTQYDGLDRVQSRTFPSGLTLDYEYDAWSYLKRIYSGSTTYVTIDEVNGRGQVTKYTLGNGKQSIYEYFHGIPVKYTTTDGSYEYNMQWDYKNGNLLKRWDQYGNKDTMDYDILDRLARWTTQSSTGAMRRDTMTYADNGNILTKTDVGTYTYDAAKIYATTEITNPKGLIKDAQQYITYNSFLQPDTIREGPYTLVYTYGYHGNRIKSVLTYSGVVKETKYYLGEYEKVITTQGTAMVHYISVDGQLKVIIDSQGSTHTPHYVYTDHLGSIVQVTNTAGNIEVTQNFDPWGRRRYMGTWTYIDESEPSTHPIWLYRGYTGHEYLPEFRLINMNGRMYDPELARMLSPDNIVPDGGFTQSYNRYTYGFNNPFKYTDPDGNEPLSLTTIVILSVFVSVGTNGVSNHFQGKPFYDGAVKAALWGVVTGTITFGIGNVATTIGNTYLRVAFQATAHGLYNGISAELQGGKFIHGFAAGSIASLGAGLGKDVLKLGTIPQILIGGVSGGVASAVVGGDFYRGFAQGLVVSAFNHAVHDATSDGGGPPSKLDQLAAELEAMKTRMSKLKISNEEMLYYSSATGVSESIYRINLVSENKFMSTIGKNLGRVGVGLNVLGIGLSGVSIYQNSSTQNVLSESYNITGNILSIGVGTLVGSSYGGPYGAAAGVLFDVSWYSMPIFYKFANIQYNKFSTALSQFESNLRSGKIP